MLNQRQIDVPQSSSIDDVLRIARLLSNPDALEKTVAELRAAIAEAETAVVLAREAESSSDAKAALAEKMRIEAVNAIAIAEREDKVVLDRTTALVAAKRAFQEHSNSVMAEHEAKAELLKAMESELTEQRNAMLAREADLIVDIKRREDAASSVAEAAAREMNAATTLRQDYEARLEKLRSIQA